MLTTIKADFRKLFTIRSTYFISIIALAFTALLSFYFEGYKGNTGSPASEVTNRAIEVLLVQNTSFVTVLLCIIAILTMAHEYRYNTIMYTLTSSVNRSKVLLSKIVAVTGFALIFGLIMSLFSVACYYAGLSLRDAQLPAQDLDIVLLGAKLALYVVAYSLIGLFIAVIIRSLVGAIAFFFIVPNTIESMLAGFWLKDNAAYLPFQSLSGITRVQFTSTPTVGPGESAVIASAYVIGLAVISWVLFVKRDAN